ncbi:substrate-binding domain-containing protein [Selenomonas sp.]|uniref:LacI family DNA-binding transcriptional regulator n=1 Tax=Selenomonas sp. TaxID=2053611 RepID=UPI0025D24399|nr:substrate-binding domain-containing protein [Selenomonas sp.]MCI6085547.1 substrate-binding domain-containing protein [Selenomonas sp.]MDY3298404.1 substrate-binding domain-containing protein [Selenomonas sp.]MDY4417242.1 substrate-binding domain-containing protein [Selenomonas sp.]
MVTIKQIADMCGVSRGTVDRVLNNRGNVKPEKRKRVLEVMRELNYQPNPAGKALAARKHKPVVGILLPSEGIVFFDDVLETMHRMARRYEDYGVRFVWRLLRGYHADEQCAAIEELRHEVNALIVNPMSEPAVIQKIDECVADGIFVITINNDVELSHRQLYVGSDYYEGGQTAGALLQMIGPEELKTGVLMGSKAMLGHRQRLDGFCDILRKNPHFELLAVEENEDDERISYEKAKAMLEKYPELNALFVISAGASGAGQAVKELGRVQSVTLIVFDTIPTTVQLMKEGVVKAALYQHPHQQAAKAIRAAFEYLVNGVRPEKQQDIVQNEIRILQNVGR